MIEAVIGLVGVVVGGAIAVAKDVWLSTAERRRNARYVAIRIVCVLDEYVQKCVDVAFDDGTSEGRPAGRTPDGQEVHEPQVECPGGPSFPDDIDWKSIGHELMYRALRLPNAAKETDQYIAFSGDQSFPPDHSEYFEARHEGYADLGLEALCVANELRKEFGLPKKLPKAWNPDWDAERFLLSKKDELRKRRERREASSARTFGAAENDEGRKQ